MQEPNHHHHQETTPSPMRNAARPKHPVFKVLPGRSPSASSATPPPLAASSGAPTPSSPSSAMTPAAKSTARTPSPPSAPSRRTASSNSPMATSTSPTRRRPSLGFSRGFGSSRPRRLTEPSTAARFSPSSSPTLRRLTLSLAKEGEEEATEGDDVEAASPRPLQSLLFFLLLRK
ncbi:hypothetical protein Fmac_009739 [Flemingia macrophylla]|uniref:Uncharacterized protein n=1 Tax=Flemingia macrophylla TaxID=520843 RepID=A0ABD1N161_9FABA